MEEWKKNPYYITAYGLAVKHGFQGTEEEWLESLNGTDGSYMARIEKVSGTGAQGTTDTYQVILSDGSVAGTFEVYNGADGNATDIDKLRSQIGTMDKEKDGLAPKLPDETGTAKYLCQDGTWAVPPDTNTWVKMQGATAETDGSAGYVPAPPSDGHDRKYLRADGTWAETGDIEDPVEKSDGQILQFDAETGKWKAAKKYTLPVGGSAIGGVMNGGDIEIDSDGAMNIPDGHIGTSKIADGSVTRSKLSADVKVLSFTGKTVAVSDWASDSTYTDFPYRAAVACEGVTAKHYAEVTFSPADALEGIFCPVVTSYDGGVYIYASEIPGADLTILTIVCTPVE